jgi:hypothetical protein
MKVDLDLDCSIDCSIVQPVEIFTAGTTIETAVSTLISHAKKSQIKLEKAINVFVKDYKDSIVYSPGVKGKDSTVKKVINNYKGQIRQIKDIYRAAIVFNSMQTIKKVDKTIGEFLEKYNFKIIRMDNTFDSPRSSGYRDINYNVADADNQNIVGELQIQFCPIKKFSALVGHKLYKLDHNFSRGTIKELADSKINKLSYYGYNYAMKRSDPTCIADLKKMIMYKKSKHNKSKKAAASAAASSGNKKQTLKRKKKKSK